jgi:hypothetical protein
MKEYLRKCSRIKIPLSSDFEYTGNCVLNRQYSEVNFMPYRIRVPDRRGGGSLTVGKTRELTVKPCIAFERLPSFPRVNTSYSDTQLFNLNPISGFPQSAGQNDISKFDVGGRTCITRYRENAFMKVCSSGNDSQSIVISLKRRRKNAHRRQRFQQQSHAYDSHRASLMKQKLLARIESGGCCLSSSSDGSKLWRKCPAQRKIRKALRPADALNYAFELERTVVY